MPIVESYAPGTPCWVELSAHDSLDAKRFYTGLLGWSSHDIPIGEGMVYTIAMLRGKSVGALVQMHGEAQSAGAPPHWLSFISVANVDESTAKARELGAKILKEPFDVNDAGRMSLVQDPTGATFALWQPGRSPGAELVNDPGAWCWNELATPDPAAAGDFYCGLFGWGRLTRDMGGMEYTTFSNSGRPIGGMYKPGPDEPMPASWTVYFAVDDCDASLAEAQSLGGAVLAPAMDIPGVGRFAMLADPQGAVFAIIKVAAAVA